MISDQTLQNDMVWFHGRLSRDHAYRLLIEAGQQDGLFLVRESTSAPGSFVLSLWSDHTAFHYQIRHHGHCQFSIDEGPSFAGLDTLVNYYRDQAGGLATKLVRCCVGKPPPPAICQGPSISVELGKSLHRVCDAGDENELHRLLQDPNINIEFMNDEGATALHTACKKGFTGVVWKLLEYNANVNSQDNEGRTPLMYACHGGHAKVCETLLYRRNAAIQERSFGEGYVALHIAAMRGHRECVEVLLKAGAPQHPRTREGDTPKDLAKENGYYDLAVYLETFIAPAPKTKFKHWLHQNVDREAAVALLFKWQCTDGLFLIRTSTKAWGVHVLTMAVRNTPYHFQIKSVGDRWFYIDDGPLFETLPHLVEYYGALADGLPHQLTRAIQPNGNPPLPLPYNSIPLESPTMPNFNKHINNQMPSPPQPPISKPPVVRRTKSVDIAGHDDPEDYLKLEDSSRQSTRRQPPPPPKAIPPKFNRPPPPLPPEVEDSEDNPQTIIKSSELENGAELGQGEFGSVLRGVWRNPNGAPMDVALKTLHPEKVIQGEQEFLREARVMSGLNHPCIVKLLGVCLGPPLILVQELVTMGALLDYLFTFMQEISLGDLKLWAAQIAWGMMYLEEKRFVHRDLATRNILLQSKHQIKISDFGLSRAIGSGSNYYVASKGGRWPVKWYAPESINYGRFSHESDVWSYGVTLWEMFSFGQQPYGEMSGAQVMEMVENQGKRLEKPDKCPEHTYQLMLRCWDLQPEKRPTFAALHQIFKTNPLYSDVEI